MFWTFVEPGQVTAGRVTIKGSQGHHLARVLRVRQGERGVVVADGRGYEIEVAEMEAGTVVGRIVSERVPTAEPEIAITLLQAVLPNPDFDSVIENGTAVGIARFVAVQTDRSVAKPASTRQSRWQAIALSASEQSHRGAVPLVIGPVTLAAALEQVAGLRLLVLDPAAAVPVSRAIADAPAYALAVGPEGGWTNAELAVMRERGGMAVNLGPHVLRARLAPVVAAAILVQQR